MEEASYTNRDLRQSVQMAHDLASSALRELNRSPEHAEASEAVGRGLTMIDAAGKALEAGDPTEAARDLEDAERATSAALATAKRSKGAVPPGNADLSFDLLDETLSAIERAAHRVRNAASRHTTFGAIRTPPTERFP